MQANSFFKKIAERFLLLSFMVFASASAQSATELKVSQHVWLEFSTSERATILAKFPEIETIPSETVGLIQSVQAANRSSTASNSGAALGRTLGQTLYIDNAFRGSGSNYSATTQLGAALIGGAMGSTFDSAAKSRYIFNYSIKTLDGELREARVESGDEFTRPVGQCVFFPTILPAPSSLCITNKVQFLKKLSALAQAPSGAVLSQESTGINVTCRVPDIGLMRLEESICIQMEGKIEK